MRAFLVLGSEGSGTKLFTEILIRAGCAGDNINEQRWDTEAFAGDPIVWRRSVPHGEKYPDIASMVDDLRTAGYHTYAYVTTRDWTSILNSRVCVADIMNYEMAAFRLREAYPHIFSHLRKARVPFVTVSYESLMTYGAECARRLLKIYGLELGDMPELVDGNNKYYEGEFIGESLAARGISKPDWLP